VEGKDIGTSANGAAVGFSFRYPPFAVCVPKCVAYFRGWHNEIPTFDLLTTTARTKTERGRRLLRLLWLPLPASQRRLRHVLSPDTMATFDSILPNHVKSKSRLTPCLSVGNLWHPHLKISQIVASLYLKDFWLWALKYIEWCQLWWKLLC